MTEEGEDLAPEKKSEHDTAKPRVFESTTVEEQSAAQASTPAFDADQAWKALSLVNDWVRHAETKAVAALAASGVAGGFLFNLVKDERLQLWTKAVIILAAGLLVVAGSASAISLLPRLRTRPRSRTTTTSPLYFDDIAREYGKNESQFTTLFSALTANYRELTEHIARQVHANAQVARRKYRWANIAILALTAALLVIAAVAATLAGIGA